MKTMFSGTSRPATRGHRLLGREGGSLVVLPTVAGFLFALYLALAESFV
jgi:hypothetical protein